MSEQSKDKVAAAAETSPRTDQPADTFEVGELHPTGKPWMHKSWKIGPVKIPAYASTEFQIVFVALASFLCPGMFNAVNGLGGGGLVSAQDINNANTALNSTFSVVGFFAGSVVNRLGLRLTLAFGGFGYCIYVSSILCYNHTQNAGFLIFAGALLGVCAGLFWTAQGTVMMSYPSEKNKGRYISVFWMIFNLGAVIGGLIPLGQNMHSKTNSVNNGTYIAFIVLMCSGFILAGFLCNPWYVERKDGSRIIMMKNPTWKSEIQGLFHVMRTDWYIAFLFPMFFASNWFYTYHFQDVNLAKFNIRTRALNSVLYFASQIIGAWIFGFLLDTTYFRRPTRAKIVLGVLFVLAFAIWGGGYEFQRTYTRASVENNPSYELDFNGSGYIGPMFLYMFYGFYDSAWQTTCYW